MQLRWQTDLRRLLPPIRQQVMSLNWLITSLQCWAVADEWPPIISTWEAADPYEIVDGRTLYEVFANHDLQAVWGVFCGVAGEVPGLKGNRVPFADGNPKLWTEPEEFLLAISDLEIVCFDSSLTLVKFRNEQLGYQFLRSFPDGRILRNTKA